jgi:hypothetical protein
MTSAILLNIGAILGLWGVVWLLWDKYSNAPGWLLGIGLVTLIVGGYLS